jgi:hypothetical protein
VPGNIAPCVWGNVRGDVRFTSSSDARDGPHAPSLSAKPRKGPSASRAKVYVSISWAAAGQTALCSVAAAAAGGARGAPFERQPAEHEASTRPLSRQTAYSATVTWPNVRLHQINPCAWGRPYEDTRKVGGIMLYPT